MDNNSKMRDIIHEICRKVRGSLIKDQQDLYYLKNLIPPNQTFLNYKIEIILPPFSIN